MAPLRVGRVMTPRQRQGRLELVVMAVVIVALSRLVDGPAAWLVAGLLFAMMVVGAGRVLAAGAHEGTSDGGGGGRLGGAVRGFGGGGRGLGGGDRPDSVGLRAVGLRAGVLRAVGPNLRAGVLRAVTLGLGVVVPRGIPAEAIVTPAVAAIACLGALRLVPVGPALVPVLVAAGALVDASLRLEARILGRARGASDSDRSLLLTLSLLLAFLAFTGGAALVPEGLVEPGPAGGTRTPLSEGALVVLAVDALVTLLLGWRLDALRTTRVRDALGGAVGYALAIAIAAGLVRAAALPRLLGPALLTLVFFLWAAFRGTEPAARRDPRFIWQVALLAVLGLVVVGWNLMLRG